MALRSHARRLSAKARMGVAKFREDLHKRDATGKFADKPGAGDDAPRRKRAAPGSQRDQISRRSGAVRTKKLTIEDLRALSSRTTAHMTEEERRILSNYTNHSGEINRWLRTGKVSGIAWPKDFEETGIFGKSLRGLDSIMAKSSLPIDVVVSRGVNSGFAKKLAKMKPGSSFVDKGFTSTSTSLEQASGLGSLVRKSDLLLQIRVPKGTRAVVPAASASWETEQEIILNRGYKYVFRGKRGNLLLFDLEP